MIYLIDGDTLTGKTTYLRKYMKEHSQKCSRYMTDEEWMEMLVDCANKSVHDGQCVEILASSFSQVDIICIDNIDFLKDKTATQLLSAKTILELNKNRDILLAGIDLRRRIKTMIEEFLSSGADISFVDFNGTKKVRDKV